MTIEDTFEIQDILYKIEKRRKIAIKNALNRNSGIMFNYNAEISKDKGINYQYKKIEFLIKDEKI